MNLKTVETKAGHVLDLSEYEFNSVQDIVTTVMQTCEKYHVWGPSHLPDIVILSKEQRVMFPENVWLMTSPYNVMEMFTEGVDNAVLEANNEKLKGNDDNSKIIT